MKQANHLYSEWVLQKAKRLLLLKAETKDIQKELHTSGITAQKLGAVIKYLEKENKSIHKRSVSDVENKNDLKTLNVHELTPPWEN